MPDAKSPVHGLTSRFIYIKLSYHHCIRNTTSVYRYCKRLVTVRYRSHLDQACPVTTVHGALRLAARHPANKAVASGIQPFAVRRLLNGLDALQLGMF